jgi:hypothetical protein
MAATTAGAVAATTAGAVTATSARGGRMGSRGGRVLGLRRAGALPTASRSIPLPTASRVGALCRSLIGLPASLEVLIAPGTLCAVAAPSSRACAVTATRPRSYRVAAAE